MAVGRLLAIPSATKGGQKVAVEVKQKGRAPLDLELVGCDGQSIYVTSVKQGNHADLKHKFKGGKDEWEAIVSYFLLQKQPEEDHAKALDGVKIVAMVEPENRIQLIIRRDVGGIKVTLGEISLPFSEEYEIDPFEWAYASAEAHASALQELADFKTKMKDGEKTVERLNQQMEEFLAAKRETENEMLEKFKTLLNEKKRKIRDQQRLLAGAKVDKAAATAVKAARDSKPRRAGPSRTSKRKAPREEVSEEPAEHPENDDMDVDSEVAAEEQEEEAETPDKHTDDDATEDGGDLDQSPSPPPKDPQKRVDPPPRRDLPFHRPATRSQPTKEKAANDDDDETEDEEL